MASVRSDVLIEEKAAVDESKAFDKAAAKGREGGLYRACMSQIRGSHSVGQSLRLGLVATGLLSDVNCYTEALVQFYVCTKALDKRLRSSSSSVVAKVHSAVDKYSFVAGYEADLRQLLGEQRWTAEVEARTSVAAATYCQRLAGASDLDLVAAVFVLHGALIIGGGAAMEPRVKARFKAVELFKNVIGPGRADRRTDFMTLFDQLIDESNQPDFKAIVSGTGEFMEQNNALMLGMHKKPYWYYPAVVAFVGIAAGITLAAIRYVAPQVFKS
ncbi:unnamed protein product [Polarella glacialis]|uniref:Heme oxygenase n=1 Tax=Polarella glacialis TaxID=89957 RepID=A0A813JJ54_POLGL|nr:unnamed protein product [Polarella glacialis]